MKESLSPKQVARAIEVSESSVKRWCDKGVMATEYTAGGHRRIPISAFLKFLTASKRELIRPEVIGLPAITGKTVRVLDRAAEQMTEALVAGDEESCRRIVLDLYLAEHSIARICDLVIAAAFEEMGARWACGDADIYQERRGCEIAFRIFYELRSLLPAPTPDAPVAIGGATAGDPYSLGSSMVELVLRDAQWNTVSLGGDLPFPTLAAAIKKYRPRLFWISASHIVDEEDFPAQYQELYDSFGLDVAFVVGGRALTEPIRQQMKYAAYCDNLQHLEAFAQSLHGSGSTAVRK